MKVKALGLLSGGLDSILAMRLLQRQGIDVVAYHYLSPFVTENHTKEAAKRLGVRLIETRYDKGYFHVLRKPKHGYGKNFNPCVDCRIFMLKHARKVAKKIGAKFLFTGEVLDERPMSQNYKAMKIVEKEAGLEGKLLRPLSAKLLPLTEAEKRGWVDRGKLLEIRGRSRKKQMELAKKFKVKEYPTPSGGCLLTYKEFANKARDLFKHKKVIATRDIELLKIGRHFRFGKNKIIVGRNENENKLLKKMKGKGDYLFEADIRQTPTTILQGPKTKEAIKKAATITARYSDAQTKKVLVKYGKKLDKDITVSPIGKKELDTLRLKQIFENS